MSVPELVECVGGPADGLEVVPGRSAVLLLGIPVGAVVQVHAYELRGDRYHHVRMVGTKGGVR